MRVAAQMRLGETEAARAAVADYVKRGGQDTIANEESWPQIEPDRTQFLDVLRKAGFPDPEGEVDYFCRFIPTMTGAIVIAA